jgi:hypothetical protein
MRRGRGRRQDRAGAPPGGGCACAVRVGLNVSQVFETGIWVFHVGQVRRGGRAGKRALPAACPAPSPPDPGGGWAAAVAALGLSGCVRARTRGPPRRPPPGRGPALPAGRAPKASATAARARRRRGPRGPGGGAAGVRCSRRPAGPERRGGAEGERFAFCSAVLRGAGGGGSGKPRRVAGDLRGEPC